MSETLADSSRREAKSSVLFDKDHQRWIFGATRKARVRRSLVAEAVEDDDYDGEGENLDDDYDPYDDPNVSLVEIPVEKFKVDLADYRNFKNVVRKALKKFVVDVVGDAPQTDPERTGEKDDDEKKVESIVNPAISTEKDEGEGEGEGEGEVGDDQGDDDAEAKKELLTAISQLNTTIHNQEIPHIFLRCALDMNDDERAAVRRALHILWDESVVGSNHVSNSYRRALTKVDEYSADCPRAGEIITEFITDAIVRGYLDKEDAKELTSERLSDDERRSGKERINQMLEEYDRDWDEQKACEIVKGLNRQLHCDVIKRTISKGLDKSEELRERASRLLVALVGSGIVKYTDAEVGIAMLLENVEDLYLDVPDVVSILPVFIARAVVDEVVSPSFLSRQDLCSGDLGYAVIETSRRLVEHNKVEDFLADCWIIHGDTDE